MSHAVTLAMVCSFVLAPMSVAAQDTRGPSPWGDAIPSQAPTVSADTVPAWSSAWPVAAGTHARAVASHAPGAESSTTDPLGRTSTAALTEPMDPGEGHFFQMPTARVVRLGDVEGHYISDLGWLGIRSGIARGVDVGVGVPYYFLGLSVDARVTLTHRAGFAVAWWGYATVPFQPGGALTTTNLGFTWNHAGMGWITGPLVSVWGERAGFHAGMHVAQRTGLGGAWLMSHATVEVRIVSGIKFVSQVVAFAEMVQEHAPGDSSVVANGQRHFLPYVLGGPRFYTRRFAADFGVLIPLDAHDPLYTSRVPVLPWVSLSHLF